MCACELMVVSHQINQIVRAFFFFFGFLSLLKISTANIMLIVGYSEEGKKDCTPR